jgi:3-oxoacyl-[acyl-carrier protein] reductase
MHIRFDERVVLVTGAAQGIGRAIARAFAFAGARIVLADIDERGMKGLGRELSAPTHKVDLSDRAAVQKMVGDVAKAERRIDVLVHSAGGVRGQVGGPIEAVDEKGWREIFAANVDSAMWLAQAVAPGMRKGGWGRIITISSGAGLRPSLTGIQAYTAAKHALVGLTKQLSQDLARGGITVNSVAPGFVPSNPSSIRQWESYAPEKQKAILDSIHTRRLGKPEDIAAAVLFLASEEAAWITGEILSVNGGRS